MTASGWITLGYLVCIALAVVAIGFLVAEGAKASRWRR
jgi:hypothetical protein